MSGPGLTDRDTKRLNETGSSPATEEEIGLAPLEEEAAKAKEAASTDDDLVTSSDVNLSQRVRVPGSGSSKRSLWEEELHDPELEAIKRKVAQRAQHNPLQPPNYVPPSKGTPVGVWLLIGGVVVVVVAVVAFVAMHGG